MDDDPVTSPELILVSSPEVAARARAALPDFAHEYEVRRVRAAYARAGNTNATAAAATVPTVDSGLSRGSVTFLMVVLLNCVAPFVLLILARA
jgi:hypothetical protein